jgi:hypothetical protein
MSLEEEMIAMALEAQRAANLIDRLSVRAYKVRTGCMSLAQLIRFAWTGSVHTLKRPGLSMRGSRRSPRKITNGTDSARWCAN